MAPKLVFLPYVRKGAVASIDPTAADTLDGKLPARASVSVETTVSGGGTTTVSLEARLYGPGDVTGLDPRQVIRTDPAHQASDVEPDYLACIEFKRPDFPWIFTPAAPASGHRLTPWLALIVVEREDRELSYVPPNPLPTITVPLAALPDLREAWAWAHAQVAGEESPQTILDTYPERTLSRLVCPRRLAPRTAYYACVVPTFDAGVRAGLGQDPGTPQHLAFAWQAGSDGSVSLPVYYHWEFSTGAGDDFEGLVWKLKRGSLPAAVGTRMVAVDAPGWPQSLRLPVEGALRARRVQPPSPTPLEKLRGTAPYQAFQEGLRALINDSAPLPTGMALPPPLYGRWHAAERALAAQPRHPWLAELNLNPSYRVAAAIGAQIVRDQQEQLMTAAWAQVGEVRRANQALRQGQLATATSTLLYTRRLASLDPATLAVVTGPVHSRVRDGGGTHSIAATVRGSRVPAGLAGGPLRRLLRPRGPLARRTGSGRGSWAGRLVRRINDGELALLPPTPAPGGMITMDQITRQGDRPTLCNLSPTRLMDRLGTNPPAELALIGLLQLLPRVEQLAEELAQIVEAVGNLLRANPAAPAPVLHALTRAAAVADEAQRLARSLADQGARLSGAEARRTIELLITLKVQLDDGYRAAAGDFALADAIDMLRRALRGLLGDSHSQRYLTIVSAALAFHARLAPCSGGTPMPAPLALSALREQLLAALNPAVTIVHRVLGQVSAPHWQPEDRLEPVMAAPAFPAPMYRPLAELSQEWLLPGLEQVPPNTLALLETNPAFVEAYMVGLNHELGRELLWRGYPTDQRGTSFHTFWETRGRPSAEGSPTQQDIPQIVEWEQQLGGHLGGGGEKPVLLLRGDLLRRYPRAVIVLVAGETGPEGRRPRVDPEARHFPVFRGSLEPDITFLGFDVDLAAIHGDPGYYLVVEQPPTEPRFGLDGEQPDIRTHTWRDLSWPAAGIKPGELLGLSGAAKSFPQGDPGFVDDANLWGKDSAAMATITLQMPFRIAIHASDLLPQ